ncbi:hypothetical protein JCM11491_001733 [Sporobolomyces phaffii]
MSSTSFLESLLSLADAQLEHALTLASVHPVLVALVAAGEGSARSNDRHLIHLVVQRAARVRPDLALVVAYVRAYYLTNQTAVRLVVDDAFATSLALKQTYAHLVPNALADVLVRPRCRRDETAAALTLYLAASRHLSSGADAESTTTTALLVPRLAALYATLAAADNNNDDERDDELRLLTLSVTASVLTLPALSLDQLDRVLSTALALSDGDAGGLIRDVERYLHVSDDVATRVHGEVGTVARRVKDSIGKLRKLGLGPARKGKGRAQEEGHGEGERDWLERIRTRYNHHATPDRRQNPDDDDNDAEEEEAVVEQAVAAVHELFPDLSRAFVRLALDHAAFRSPQPQHTSSRRNELTARSERLVASLLEDDLPDELRAARASGTTRTTTTTNPTTTPAASTTTEGKEDKPRAAAPPAKAVGSERRNVYEDDRHFTKGRLVVKGQGGRSTRDDGAAAIELDARLKAQIEALAARESSDEDDDDAEAFLDENEDAGGGGRRGGGGQGRLVGGVRDNGDEDDSDEPGQEPSSSRSGIQTPIHHPPGDRGANTATSHLFSRATVQLLERAYLADPSVFGADSATRRTNRDRIALRAATGLDDQQLEGWRSMLERAPGGVDKVREKLMDLDARGNHRSSSSDAQEERGNGSNRGGGRGGRGGRGGGGRGGGGRGGGGGARGGAGGGASHRGKGDGGRAQHDRRKRGNDKKMQKMGATL